MNKKTFYYCKTEAGPALDEKETKSIWQLTHAVKESRSLLDSGSIYSMLTDNAVYEAQNIETPIAGKENIGKYLDSRFEFLKDLRDQGQDIGELIPAIINLPHAKDHPCLIFEISNQRPALWVLSVTQDELIQRIDILTDAPLPSEARKL